MVLNTVRLFAAIYRFLLLLPMSRDSGKSFLRSRSLTFINSSCVIYYWIGFIVSLSTQDIKTNLISKTSNAIQLLVNALGFTVVILNPCIRFSCFQEILVHIQTLEVRLLTNGIFFKDGKIRRNALIFFIIPTIFLLYILIFDSILTFKVQKTLGILYWIISIIPFNFILFTNIQLCLFLLLIRTILKRCTEILARELYTPPAKVFVGSSERRQPTLIPGIFYILTDVIDLSELVNTYFGPIFLITFSSIFVTSSIQLYYIYIVLTAVDDESPWDNLKIFSFVGSINIVFPNLILCITVTWLCQGIRNVSRKNVVLIQKLQNRGSRDLLPVEIQKIVAALPYCTNEITFSAMDCFKIDLNMLVGMFGTILTYLVIFIQFSNIYGVGYDMTHLMRSGLTRDSKSNM
uniref:Gustatory receptor n=1 Tax=Lutzomyia longipalpis TaxID=7200 RepID=A0A3F2ZDD9_LUTLO